MPFCFTLQTPEISSFPFLISSFEVCCSPLIRRSYPWPHSPPMDSRDRISGLVTLLKCQLDRAGISSAFGFQYMKASSWYTLQEPSSPVTYLSMSVTELAPEQFVCSRDEQGSEETITVRFEVSVAVSGIIAPNFYVHIRKAQSDRQRSHEISLKDIGFKDGCPTACSSEHSCDLGLECGSLSLARLPKVPTYRTFDVR